MSSEVSHERMNECLTCVTVADFCQT